MRPVRSLFVSAGVVGIVFAVSVLGPSAMAGTTLTPIHITKECSEFTGDVPSFCTVTGSDLAAIPVGTKIFYFGPVITDPNFLSSRVVIRAGHGDRARGYCSVIYLDPPTDTHGVCTFWKGTGALHGFHASVDYSIDSSGVLHWDGNYQLG